VFYFVCMYALDSTHQRNSVYVFDATTKVAVMRIAPTINSGSMLFNAPPTACVAVEATFFATENVFCAAIFESLPIAFAAATVVCATGVPMESFATKYGISIALPSACPYSWLLTSVLISRAVALTDVTTLSRNREIGPVR